MHDLQHFGDDRFEDPERHLWDRNAQGWPADVAHMHVGQVEALAGEERRAQRDLGIGEVKFFDDELDVPLGLLGRSGKVPDGIEKDE